MDPSLRRAERYYVKLIIGSLVGILLFIALCWGGYQAYSRWQEHQYLRQAHVAFDKNDLKWAALAARRAFSWRPDSIDACRLLGHIAERQGAPEAIDWRRRAVELDPNSVPDLIFLAETALRFGRTQLAVSALERVPPAKRQDAGYQSAAARLALAQNNSAGALQHFSEAARLAPNDPQRQLTLAQYELRSDDPARRDHGRGVAKNLAQNPQVRIPALQILLEDAARQGDSGAAIGFARELLGSPEAPFIARLDALTAFGAFKDPDFNAQLGHLQEEAQKSRDKAVALIDWMNNHNLALLAVDWAKRLPKEITSTMAMHAVLADTYVLLRDWTALAANLKSGNWTQAEFLRLALQAKVARETGDEAGSETNWAAAVNKAGSEKAQLEVLQRLAVQWRWESRAAQVLWLLAENPQTQQEALRALYKYYRDNNDTAGLYRVLIRLVQIMPGDSAVRNNLAQVSLLLNVESSKARVTAKELNAKEPHNPAYASTYAFALFRDGNVPAALKVMQSIPLEQRKDPAIAAYYGIILARSKNNEAGVYLDLGAKATLLPEEENLVAAARKEIAQR
jgi:cytochrome c-type biogenesis protein CcmH/NrfG